MMKILKPLLALVAICTFSRCDNDLDLKPISEETSSSAYLTPSQIEAALIGVYDAFGGKTENFYNEYYQWDMLNFQETRADNNYAGGDVPELFAVDLLNIVATNSRLDWHWGALYSAIGKANNVLERAPLVEDEDFRASRMGEVMGEAYFLRAYHYYHLVTLWSGVPLVLKTTTSIEPEELYIPRSTSEQVYAQILEDLDQAISLLPDEFGSVAETKARATSGAANALAAKASLQKPNPNYQAALDYILALESSSADYRLLGDYNHLFDGNHENNAESIFEMQFVGGTEGSLRPQLLLPPSLSGDGWRKFMTPSQDLINAYQAAGDDIRLNASVVFEAVPWIDEYWGNQLNSSVPFVYKWKTAGGWASDNNNYLIRYGDIVLLKAEALNGLDRLNDAAAEVNRIRNRVDLGDLTPAEQSSQAVLKQVILDERRLELAFEGERWNDLIRNDAAVSTMNNLVEIDLRTGNPVEYNMTVDKKFLPIPQTEMDLNPELEQGEM